MTKKNDSHLCDAALRTKVSKGRKDGVIKKRLDESKDSSGEFYGEIYMLVPRFKRKPSGSEVSLSDFWSEVNC